jgi:hypothetical protein
MIRATLEKNPDNFHVSASRRVMQSSPPLYALGLPHLHHTLGECDRCPYVRVLIPDEAESTCPHPGPLHPCRAQEEPEQYPHVRILTPGEVESTRDADMWTSLEFFLNMARLPRMPRMSRRPGLRYT